MSAPVQSASGDGGGPRPSRRAAPSLLDGAVSRAIRGRLPERCLGRGLELAHRAADWAANRNGREPARMRWIELRNKIAAYRLFEGREWAGHDAEPEAIGRLDPYRRLFAAEGYGYRQARRGLLAPELASWLSPIAIHAGAGVWRAERALESIAAGRWEREIIAEYAAECGRDAWEGYDGIVQEALGLAARTLYPHLIPMLDLRLRATSEAFWERFWHGVGRGIYFAPSNVSPFRAAPWMGVRTCAAEPPHATGRRNAISGFCFALTLVNLRHPEILKSFLEHHAVQDADGSDGVEAALAVWALTESGGISDPRPERLFSTRQREETIR